MFVVPAGYRTHDYEVAAYDLIGANREEWAPRNTEIRLANPAQEEGQDP